MTKPARRPHPVMIGTVLLTVAAIPCAALAGSATPYLTWQNKAPAAGAPGAETASEIHTTSGNYPVPPSPYGQVGNPYGKSLSWPSKGATAVQQVAAAMPPPSTPQYSQPLPQQPVFAPVPAPPVHAQQTASITNPIPVSRPAPVAVVPLPPVPQPEDPGLADDPGMADDAPIITPAPAVASIQPLPSQRQPAPPMPAPKPVPAPAPAPERPVVAPPVAKAVAVTPQPQPEPAPVVASAPPPVQQETAPPSPAVASAIASDGAYQVPTTSKYAARIEAARVAQLPQAQEVKPEPPAQVQSQADASAKPVPQATAPEPAVSMASQEADHIFIPGELIRTPADEPRQYSLHRQYGLRPDPIQVDHNATGALLTLSPDMVEGGDPNDDTDDTPPTRDQN